MKSFKLNSDLTVACEALHEALSEGTDSIAFEELSTIQLIEIQNHINKMLIKRLTALQSGVVAMMQLDEDSFNDRQEQLKS